MAASALPPALARVVHRQAGDIVARLLASDASQSGGASLKSLTLAAGIRAKSATHAVCCETLKYLSLVRQLAEEAGLTPGAPGAKRRRVERVCSAPPAHLFVLVYELLFGRGCAPDGEAERCVCDAEEALRAALRRRLEAAGASDPAALLPPAVTAALAAQQQQPRCVRVNTLRLSVPEAVRLLLLALPGVAVTPDPLLPDVLQLPHGTDLHALPLVASGCVLLQSRGSCMAAHALAPSPGWSVADACAAPGNKTTHLAAVMQGRGRVFAFDADAGRLGRLRDAAVRTGSEGVVTARCADFLQLDPAAEPLCRCQALLLDPSCSGSGTALTRGDALLPSALQQGDGGGADPSGGRVAALARFQLAALRHALRCPRLQRLVYSTCSCHAAENEGVVALALPHAQHLGWRLAAALPDWHRRGLPGCGLSDAQAACVLRTDPMQDGCDGFFLALFVREPQAQPERAKQAAPADSKASEVRWAGGGKAAKGGRKNKPLFV